MKTVSQNWQRIVVYSFIGLCILVMAFNASNNPLSIGNTSTDSSVFNYVAKVIINGGMPYRDTFDHKGPLIYIIDAAGILINNDIGIWLFELISIFLIFLFGYKIAVLQGCGQVSVCIVALIDTFTLACFFEGGNLVEEYACVFLTISLYIFLKFFSFGNVKKRELVICGASFGAVCMLRINMIALWIIMCIGVLSNRIYNKKAKDIINYIKWFIVGFGIVVVPIVLWLIKNNAFTAFIQDYLLFNLMYSTDAERAQLSNVIKALLNFSTTGPMVITFPILVYYCIHDNEIKDWLCLFTVICSLLLMCISGQKYGHYGMVLCPLVSYSVGRMLSDLDTGRYKMSRRSKCAFIVSFLLMLMLLFSNTSKQMVKTIVDKVQGNGIAQEVTQIVSIIQENTEPEDTISVCGNKDIIYLLSNRMSASKYSYQSPIARIDSRIRDEYFEDIMQSNVRMIIIEEGNFLFSDIMAITDGKYDCIAKVGKTNILLNRSL